MSDKELIQEEPLRDHGGWDMSLQTKPAVTAQGENR